MAITTTTHLNFRGQARAALEFYQSVFGGQVALISYQDAHNVQDPAEADQIMWGQVHADNGFHVMAYDVPSAQSYAPGDKPVFVSVRGDTDATEEITTYWKGLSQGATIQADLGPAPWGAPLYGMLTDRFGVTWVLDVQASY
jgi:PhnB protein